MEDVSSLFSNPLFHHVVNHALKTPLSQSEPVLYDCLWALSNFQQIYKNGFESNHATYFALRVSARGHSLRGSKATQVSTVLWLSDVRLLAAVLSGNGLPDRHAWECRTAIWETYCRYADVTPNTCYITLNDAGVVVFFMFYTTKQILYFMT